MSQNILKLLLTLFLLILTPSAFADESVCAPEEARQAERVAANLKDWSEVYAAYTKFLACDDGAIGEGFSDSIGRLLAKKWVTLNELTELSKNNVGFEKFVFRHIDETLSDETLRTIKENAKNRCPIQQVDFCRKIENSINQ